MKKPKFNRVWGVVTADNRLVRLTFSPGVAALCASYEEGSEVKRFRIKRGRQLQPGEVAGSGVYLVCTSKCGSPLRAQLDPGFAAAYYDPDYRHIYEAHLDR